MMRCRRAQTSVSLSSIRTVKRRTRPATAAGRPASLQNLVLYGLVLSGLLLSGAAGIGAEQRVEYLKDVKPLLMAKCSRCHNAAESEGSLRLDTAVELLKGGSRGPSIIAGQSSESLLVQAVLQQGELKMPPEGPALSEEQVNVLRRWIDQGAAVPEDESRVSHWAFRAPVRPEVPTTAAQSVEENPIDAFVGAEYQHRGLTAVSVADPHVLLRRVCLDLTGLPPTPQQVDAFLQDPSLRAWENVVDDLLASPRYGERWGRHWMDVWRYSDWDGYGAEVRESKPHIWRWRDWIVESLNHDRPYNQMVLEMLAGDEVAPEDQETLRATGFLVRNWYTFNRNVWLDNVIEHTGKAFLGLTWNCARCHDHMYDPMSQVEYYQLRAFFEPHEIRTDPVPGESDVARDGLVRVYDASAAAPTVVFVRGDEKNPLTDRPLGPAVPRLFGIEPLSVRQIELPAAGYYPGMLKVLSQESLAADRRAVDAASAALATAESDSARQLAAKAVAVAEAKLEFTEARQAADQASYATPPAAAAIELSRIAARAERELSVRQEELHQLTAQQTLAAAEAAFQPDNAEREKAVTDARNMVAAATESLHKAAQALSESSDTYTRATPVYPTTSTGRRTALGQWIADNENPLTARVAVNHIWLRHFYQPLVPTVFDFGMNGQPPSHPALLDWLACELMSQGWRMKPLHRLIVTSRTYRLASSPAREELPAQSVTTARDPDNRFLWRQNSRRMEAEVIRDATLAVAGRLDTEMRGPDLDPQEGLTRGRRSIYFRSSKEKKMTFLATFDSANPSECYRRPESISPQQSLAMSNSPLTLAQSRNIAGKLSQQAAADDPALAAEQFVRLAFVQVLSRPAVAAELKECLEFLTVQAERLKQRDQLTPFAGTSSNLVEPSADAVQRARENLIHVLLNHNDFVTIR